MYKNKKKWKMQSQKLIYDKYIRLYEEEIKLPTGETIQYVVNRSGEGAGVLLSPEPGSLLVTYQYRYPINQWIYDLPGGYINKQETPKKAAIRECIEETGYKPLKLQKLTRYYPMPSRSDGALHIFFSNSFEKVDYKQSSNTENTFPKIIQIKEIEKLVRENKIIDPSLLIAWHTAKSIGLI